MIYNVIKSLDPFATIIGGISTIIIIIQSILKLHDYLKDKRYIKTMLRFKNKECIITQTVYYNSDINANEVVTNASMQSFQMINNMLYKVSYRIIPCANSFIGKNIIHIGGPASNIHVNALFIEHNYKFEFWTPKTDKHTHNDLKLNSRFIHYTEDDTRKFIIGNIKLEIKENERDYALIVRMPSDNKSGVDFSTHIIFGCKANGTLKGIEYFTNNYKMIAKLYGKSKYCFAVPINLIDNTITISNEKIIDLTNDFFN